MNKRLNTVLFFLGASLAHLVIVAAIVAALFLAWVFFVAPWVPGPTTLLALILIIVAALMASFPLYRRLLVWFQNKVDMDKYFDPSAKMPPRRR